MVGLHKSTISRIGAFAPNVNLFAAFVQLSVEAFVGLLDVLPDLLRHSDIFGRFHRSTFLAMKNT